MFDSAGGIFWVVSCTLMSMVSNALEAGVCKVDLCGLVRMLAAQGAWGRLAALVDWDNNHGDDPDACVVFHCATLARGFFESERKDCEAIIAGSVEKENTHGTLVGRIAPRSLTFCRVSTWGRIMSCIGDGEFTDASLTRVGGYGVMRTPRLPASLQFICREGLKDHVAITWGWKVAAIAEVFGKHLGWDLYEHQGE